MKRSKKIDLTIITILAASFSAACNIPEDSSDVKHCVNKDGVVVDDSQCAPLAHGYSPFRWYYGGSRIFNTGTRVSGGGYVPAAGRSYLTPSTVSRGGFGTTARSAPPSESHGSPPSGGSHNSSGGRSRSSSSRGGGS